MNERQVSGCGIALLDGIEWGGSGPAAFRFRFADQERLRVGS